MTDVFVAGVAMTPLGKHLNSTIKSMTAAVVRDVLADSGLQVEDLEAAFFSNSRQSLMEGQNCIRGQIALRSVGVDAIPISNVENACASSSTGFHLAYQSILSGQYDIVLVVGAEKMHYENIEKERITAAFLGGMDVSQIEQTRALFASFGNAEQKPQKWEEVGQESIFMYMYSAIAKEHFAQFGTTQKDLAIVASKNHFHSTLNSNARYRHPMSVEEVLSDREIAWPLTRSMCAPLSDGAAAAILMSKKAALKNGLSRAARVRASVLGSGRDRDPRDFSEHVGRRTSNRAYELAGVSPSDLDFAEIHDASSFAEILQCENLGICEPGRGGAFAASGATTLGGSIPVNPSGGLISKGHPIAATGLIQIYELVTQLRHEAEARQVDGAKIGIAENGGGFVGVEDAAVVVTILEQVS